MKTPLSQDSKKIDALLVFSFGGPEKKEEVMPFLEHVTQGKNIPKHRLAHVAEHYNHFNGKSPINDQNRKLIEKVSNQFKEKNIRIPIYFGNLHATPFLEDTAKQMAADGVKRVAVFCTSAFSSFSGCKKYRNALEEVQEQLQNHQIVFEKIRLYYNHPGFIQSMVESVENALSEFRSKMESSVLQDNPLRIIFTAHSIPEVMAASCQYENQLNEACTLVMKHVTEGFRKKVSKTVFDSQPIVDWKLAFQSRSGPPMQPWLEPDIEDAIKKAHGDGKTKVVVVPLGFVSDHMEVMWDLDVEAKEACQKLGIQMVRAKTASNFPAFIDMVEDLLLEKMDTMRKPKALGTLGVWPVPCPESCCIYQRP